MCAESGETSMRAARWATVTEAVPAALPEAAVTVAFPFATAVTRPPALTLATEFSLVVQLTGAPAIGWPFWSATAAVSWSVSPRDERSTAAGEMLTVVATGGSGGSVGAASSSPPQATIRASTRMGTATVQAGAARHGSGLLMAFSPGYRTGSGSWVVPTFIPPQVELGAAPGSRRATWMLRQISATPSVPPHAPRPAPARSA